MVRFAAVITAAGSSRRFNAASEGALKKEFERLGDGTVLSCAVRPFLDIPGLACVVITYREGELETVKSLLGSLDNGKTLFFFVQGGETRRDSVFNALKFLHENGEPGIEMVAIHDGARPFVSRTLIESCLAAAEKAGGSCPCIPVTDTVVRTEEGLISGRLSRQGLCTVQTPQVFRFPYIYHAHLKADPDKAYTDDTEIFMDFGGSVASVPGESSNRKITFAQDLTEGK